jgi:hypothetical protein
MNSTTLPAALLWLICTVPLLHGQTSSGGRHHPANAEGYRFIVGFMQNDVYDQALGCRSQSVQQIIIISSRFSTRVKITPPEGSSIEYDVAANKVLKVPVPASLECIGEGVFNKGIEVEAVHPISVTCFSSTMQSSDGYQALPVSQWGTEYVSANYVLDHYTNISNDTTRPEYFCQIYPRGGEFTVIAAFDSTIVTIVPSTKTKTAAAGGVVTRTLKRGEIFQVQDGGTQRGQSDLTGSRITSNKPVGLLSGHMRAAVPYMYETKNHLIEMLPPKSRLGTRHMIVPFHGHTGGDHVRIIASENSTTVTVQTATDLPFIEHLQQAGEYLDVPLAVAAVITSSRPVLVAQYCQSVRSDTLGRYDPFRVAITPEEQFLSNATIHTLPNRNAQGEQQFEHHYMTIMADSNVITTITINGENLMSSPGLTTGNLVATGFRWATLELPDNRSFSIDGKGAFGGYVFGVGYTDAYGWPIVAGETTSDSGCIPGIMPSGTIALCDGDSVVLDAGPARTYAWSTGATTRTINVGRAGNYSVTTIDTAGCVGTSVPVSVRSVKIAPILLSPDGPLALCPGDSLNISLPDGFASYLWSTGERTRSITIRDAGTYTAMVTTAEGCSAMTDTLRVSMSTPVIPVIAREGDRLGTQVAQAYQWYRDGQVLQGETSRTIQPLQSGRYTVRTVDQNGCVSISAPFDVTWLGVEDDAVSVPLHVTQGREPREYVIVGRFDGRVMLQIDVTDMLGRTIFSRTTEGYGSISYPLSFDELPAGSYLVRVSRGSSMHVWRVVVQ